MDVFIATPSYDGSVCGEYAASLCETSVRLTQAGIGIYHVIAPGNPFLDLARNELAQKFLDSGAESLLFIDADVGWDSKAVTRVLAHCEEVVGGLVPKRDMSSESTFHMNAITGVMSASGLFECIELPTAFMRIKRSAFDRLRTAGPDRPFFKIGSAQEDFGEDIYFCRRWIELGRKLWIDADITFTHTGRKSWRGNFFEHCISSGLLKQNAA